MTEVGHSTKSFTQVWTNILLSIRQPVTSCLFKVSSIAARNPKSVVTSIILTSITILGVGLFTNFHVETNSDTLWTPRPSAVLSHGKWLTDEAGFPTAPRQTLMTVHANGGNVLSKSGLERVFTALDVVRNIPGYDAVCEKASVSMLGLNGEVTCSITSVTRFWNYDLKNFQDSVTDDKDAIQVVSEETFADGTPVDELSIFGNPKRTEEGFLASAEMFIVNIDLPRIDESFDLERDMIDNVLKLRDAWEAEDDNSFQLEFFAQRSFDDEFERAIISDLPLLPMIFIVMSIFTCLIFFRRSWIDSRSTLGFGAVATALLSIMSGYGIMFTIGVPFTAMTQILPFIIFGVGLDNAFILMGAYQRTNTSTDGVERIHETVQEVGVSIFLTTITSVVAFSLGTMSSIPAVYWLCQYATPTIAINFFFQLTFFVALIVLDERRVQMNRRDCLICFLAPTRADIDDDIESEGEDDSSSELNDKGIIFDKLMKSFGNILMMPVIKGAFVIFFLYIFCVLAYSSTKLTQEFNFTDVLPSISYAGDFWNTFKGFSGVSGVAPYIVFRNIDQGDPQIQEQMEAYVNDIVSIDSVSNQPVYFWLRDLKDFVSSSDDTSLEGAPFNLQLDAFLADPSFKQLYEAHIVRDSEGYVLASRTQIRMDQIGQDNVVQEVNALRDQRKVSESSGLNKGIDDHDWSVFTFDDLYYIWQFYTDTPSELLQSTILGVSSVSLIALVFIPHFSAILFILPLISMLYIDLLGFLQLCGVHINAVSYVSLVMAIGLMVDFIMHILLRYYESKESTREGKVKDTLEDMGTSILIGAMSTFLGVIPLAFSSNSIFSTIFYAFLGLIVLGASHGLVFLPVMLSFFGPTVVLDLSHSALENKSDEEGQDSENASTVVQSASV